jgi:hypothetical protein
MYLLVLEVELPKNLESKPHVMELDPVGTSRRGDTDRPGFLQLFPPLYLYQSKK